MQEEKTKYRYKCVLLVDDDELDSFISQKVLELHRFAEVVYTASNGQAGIDFLKNLRQMKDARLPEVVFVDLNMPFSDGFMLLEYCKANLSEKQVKLAVLTSSASYHDKARVQSISARAWFLTKPLSAEALETIEKDQRSISRS